MTKTRTKTKTKKMTKKGIWKKGKTYACALCQPASPAAFPSLPSGKNGTKIKFDIVEKEIQIDTFLKGGAPTANYLLNWPFPFWSCNQGSCQRQPWNPLSRRSPSLSRDLNFLNQMYKSSVSKIVICVWNRKELKVILAGGTCNVPWQVSIRGDHFLVCFLILFTSI